MNDDFLTCQRNAAPISALNAKALALRLSRRGLLRHGAALGIGGSIVATLLAACGGSSSTPTTSSSSSQSTTASSSGGSSPASGGTSSTTTSSSSSTASSGSGDYELASDQTLRLPAGEPPTMDPEVTSGGSELFIIFNVFDGLVGVNQDTGKVEPHMAEKFEANSDASAYTFHLKDGLKWSDGSALNAHDFEWSWKRVLDPNTKSAYVPALYPIKGVVDAVKNGASIR